MSGRELWHSTASHRWALEFQVLINKLHGYYSCLHRIVEDGKKIVVLYVSNPIVQNIVFPHPSTCAAQTNFHRTYMKNTGAKTPYRMTCNASCLIADATQHLKDQPAVYGKHCIVTETLSFQHLYAYLYHRFARFQSSQSGGWFLFISKTPSEIKVCSPSTS